MANAIIRRLSPPQTGRFLIVLGKIFPCLLCISTDFFRQSFHCGKLPLAPQTLVELHSYGVAVQVPRKI